MRILGIDPGSTLIGYGLIEDIGGDKLRRITSGVLTIAEKNPTLKLLEISQKLSALLDENKLDLVGLEQLYFSKNKKTALEVSQARGVIANTLLSRGLPILEFGPAQVKIALTGYGNADKGSVAKMMHHTLNLPIQRLDDNESDALAIAITAALTHAHTTRLNKATS